MYTIFMSQLQVILHNVKNYVHFRLSCLEPFFTRFFWMSRQCFLLEQFQIDMVMVLMKNRYTLDKLNKQLFFSCLLFQTTILTLSSCTVHLIVLNHTTFNPIFSCPSSFWKLQLPILNRIF